MKTPPSPRRRARWLRRLSLAAALVLLFAAWSLRNPVRTLLSLRRPDPDAACWTLDVHGDYRLDRVLARGARDERELLEAVRAEFAPLLPRAALPPLPDFGCSTFVARTPDGRALFGRNFDLEPRTPPLVVRTRPRGGYASVSTTGLLFLGFPDGAVPSSLPRRLALLAAPFVPVDGVNEKGLAAAVLMLPGERPPEPDTGRTPIQTTLAVRLVLDRAATVDEALALLGRYEMHHAIGSAFHLHLADATGASAVVEWDGPGGAPRAVRPDAPAAPGAFAHQCCTNFRLADGAESAVADDPGRVGADRFAALEAALAPAGGVLPDADAAADLLEAVSHRRDDWGPDGETIVATQWSAVFDLAAPAVTLWPDCDRPRARRFRVTRSGSFPAESDSHAESAENAEPNSHAEVAEAAEKAEKKRK